LVPSKLRFDSTSLCPGWIKYANYISIFMAPGGIENV
jgi:hypothetical protein